MSFFGDSSGTSYGGGGGSGGIMGDMMGAVEHASGHAGSAGNSGMFSEAMSMVQGSNLSGDIDEADAVHQHKKMYQHGGAGGNITGGAIGSAASMQALKMFGGGSSGSGGVQNQFVGTAMGEAAKLWEQHNSSGNLASGVSKQSAINSAGEMAMKMYMKSEMSGGGGAGGLMSMASKFM